MCLIEFLVGILVDLDYIIFLEINLFVFGVDGINFFLVLSEVMSWLYEQKGI